MTREARAAWNYVWRWIWLVLVSLMAFGVYWLFLDLIQIMHPLPGMAEVAEELKSKPISACVLKAVAGALFWWRVVKVVVLLGSPFRLGLQVRHLRQNGAANGRVVTVAFVDCPTGPAIRLGVVARSHPTSDKIVRSRVEMLIMVLPCDWAFVVQNSRFWFCKRAPEGIGKQFFEAWKGHHLHWQRTPLRNQSTMSMRALVDNDEPR